MNFTKGNITDYAGDKKGYITGNFFLESSLNFDTNVEINYSRLPDNFTAAKHVHTQTKTWVIVTKGKMYFKIDDVTVELGQGQFVIFPKGTAEEVIKVDPGTESITIHSPSIKGGDKILS